MTYHSSGVAVVDDRTVAEIDKLEARQPAVVSLARLASVAAVVEPPLLRRLRLEVGGLARATLASDAAHQAWDAGLETDLWSSRLAHVATPKALTLRPAVLEVLRHQLSLPMHKAAAGRAHAIVADAHSGHSDMLQLEEQIIWATLQDDGQAVGACLDRALATLKTDQNRATGVVRWFTQARRRIPPSALRGAAGQRLLAAVALHLDRVIPRELLEAARFPDFVADLAPVTLPQTEIGVVVSSDGIRFTSPDDQKAGRILVPDTRPRVVEVTWHDPRFGERTTLARADDGDATVLQGVAGSVVLRTLSGRRFDVRSAEARHVVVAVFGLHTIPAWSNVADSITSLIMDAVADPEITVEVITDPRDLYDRPEVVVVGRVMDDKRLSEFLSEVSRAVTRRQGLGAVTPTFVQWGDGGRGGSLMTQFDNQMGDILRLQRVESDSELMVIVADAIRDNAETPSNLYTLDVDSALTMLNSVALAFHVRGLYGDAGDDSELFGFPIDMSLEDLPYESAADAFDFRHVRVLCEWLFAGPTRDYLAGGMDPTDVAVDARPTVTSPGWSPGDWGWESFADYLEWFLEKLIFYVDRVRNHLGHSQIPNRYAVPVDALEAARLATGTAALPLGEDEPTSYKSFQSDDSADEVLYPIERAELPDLIAALGRPILAAVAAENKRRVEAGPDLTITAEVLGAEIHWVLTNYATGARVEAQTTHDPASVRLTLSGLATNMGRPRAQNGFVGDGRRLSESIPQVVWQELRKSASSGKVPQLQVQNSVEMLWELTTVEPPVNPDLPPFLGCQSVIAVWPREVSGPRQTSATASKISVIAPLYDSSRTNMPSLPGVGLEAGFLVKRYGADRISSHSETLRLDDDVHVLHVAGHSGEADREPTVLLEDGEPYFLRLAASSVASPSLIFLSTNEGPAAANVFLEAGAPAVVAPMWPVPDNDASNFVMAFYERVLERGQPVAEVLQQLRCEGGPQGSPALAYRFFGPTDYRLQWRPSPS